MADTIPKVRRGNRVIYTPLDGPAHAALALRSPTEDDPEGRINVGALLTATLAIGVPFDSAGAPGTWRLP